MTLRKKLALRNSLREWATAIGLFAFWFGGYILAEYWGMWLFD